MSQKVLVESGSTLRTIEGGRWAATLLTPGVGSSGTYAEEMLAEFGSRAFPAGTKLWWGHPKEGEGPGDRDARDQWGYLDEDASFEPGVGVVGKPVILPHWKDVVESLGSQASLSIYAMGESDEDGNVIALHEHMTNSVDIVGYPGRPGSGLTAKLEAARAAFTQPGTASAPGSTIQTEDKVELKEVEALFDKKLAEALTPINTFLAEEGARRQAEAEAAAENDDVTEAVEAAVAAVEAVKAAKVLPSFEKKLIESAKSGADVTADLAFAVAVTAEAAVGKPADVSLGYVHESSAGFTADDFTLNKGGRR